MVTAACTNFDLVHGEFCLHLHTFLSAIHNQADTFGEEGFKSLLAGLDEGADAAAAFNTLIGLYNASLIKSRKEIDVDDDEDQDTDGEPEVPSPDARQASEIAGEDSDGEIGGRPLPPPPKKSPRRSPKKTPKAPA
jgi:hypothetical protein